MIQTSTDNVCGAKRAAHSSRALSPTLSLNPMVSVPGGGALLEALQCALEEEGKDCDEEDRNDDHEGQQSNVQVEDCIPCKY